jgi:subtilisin family serine protease
MTAFDFVGLTPLMAHTRGSADVAIGLIDGPVASDGPNFEGSVIRGIPNDTAVQCQGSPSAACAHGTFIAAMLAGICPECTLLVRPIFDDHGCDDTHLPSAQPGELAAAILDCIEAGARVINLSLALATPSMNNERLLQRALDYSILRGVIIVAAAGNQNAIGSTAITRHPWVIPVMACDLQGRPAPYSNFGRSIGNRGLSAPGAGDQRAGFHGTSIAAAYVTGAIALLWSTFPDASAQQVKIAVTQAKARRASVVSPVLDAWAAYQWLSKFTGGWNDRTTTSKRASHFAAGV